jgi:Na+-transporting methylmalonyl-CoA/oxaloacetate decarboxylase gamma subunit
MLSALAKKSSIKNALKLIFSGLSIIFIVMLLFMVVHDAMTGASSQTAEYCAKYGFLASPDC